MSTVSQLEIRIFGTARLCRVCASVRLPRLPRLLFERQVHCDEQRFSKIQYALRLSQTQAERVCAVMLVVHSSHRIGARHGGKE